MNKAKKTKKSKSDWGGYRLNAGRKATWNNEETCTIRIPKALSDEILRFARALDSGEIVEFVTESNWMEDGNYDCVTNSNSDYKQSISGNFDFATESKLEDLNASTVFSEIESYLNNFDNVTKSNTQWIPMPNFDEAIQIARKIVKQKKCARISVARLISKLYSVQVNANALKPYKEK
jgi:hypothetical protein